MDSAERGSSSQRDELGASICQGCGGNRVLAGRKLNLCQCGEGQTALERRISLLYYRQRAFNPAVSSGQIAAS